MCPTGWLYLILQCIHPLSCPKTLGVFSGFRYAIQCYHNISVCISWYICERISFTYIFRSKMLEMWQVNSEIMPELSSKVVVPITSRVWDILWSPSAPALDINTFEVFRLNGVWNSISWGPWGCTSLHIKSDVEYFSCLCISWPYVLPCLYL